MSDCPLLYKEKGLLQSGESLYDAAHGLDDVLVAGGVAHAEALGAAEGVAAYGGYVAHLQQVHGQVGAGVDGALAVALAEEG